MPSPAILHGPRLATSKPRLGEKRQPTTWPVAFRVHATMIDAAERLARELGCTKADVLRTAFVEFLAKYAGTETVNTPLTDNTHLTAPQTHSQPLSQPSKHTPYRGNGKSDHPALMALNARTADRKKTGQTGERLTDKSPVR